MLMKTFKFITCKSLHLRFQLREMIKKNKQLSIETELPEKNFSKSLDPSSWETSKKLAKIRTLCSKKTSGLTNSKK